jgi:hypothetical protein
MILIAVWLVGRALPSFRRLFIGTIGKVATKEDYSPVSSGRS